MAPVILADSRLAGVASRGFRVFGRSGFITIAAPLAVAPVPGRSLLAENHHVGLERPPASIFPAISGLQTPSFILKTNGLGRFRSGAFWHGSCFAIYGVNLTFFGFRYRLGSREVSHEK
jgi:hypothetical protein